MRPHTEAKIARLSESEAVSFGPLAHYNKLTGDDGLPIFTGVQTCKPGYQTPLHWHPYVECLFVIEGTTHGVHKDGPWSVGDPEWSAGRWCDVFEVRDWKIQRCFIYLDPDYAGQDTDRYPWLSQS